MDEMASRTSEPEAMRGTETLECRRLVKTYAHLRVRDVSAEARLSASLAVEAQTSPVIVVRDADGREVLIDGYRRVQALERLGRDTVTAIVLGLSEADALVYCHRQETSRRRSALEDGWLLRELQQQGPSLRDIGRAMNRSASWVSRRLGLVCVLPASVEQAIRRGIVPPHAGMKSLVPLARANKTHCERMVQMLGDERISTRQMAALYAAWRAGDREQKERIVMAPRLFLRAAETSRPAEPRDEIGWLIRQLGTAGEALARAGESLARAALVDAGVVENARVRRAIRPIKAAWEALYTRIEEDHAGPRHTDCDHPAAG